MLCNCWYYISFDLVAHLQRVKDKLNFFSLSTLGSTQFCTSQLTGRWRNGTVIITKRPVFISNGIIFSSSSHWQVATSSMYSPSHVMSCKAYTPFMNDPWTKYSLLVVFQPKKYQCITIIQSRLLCAIVDHY
jgi:hypothetical protein